MQKVRAEKCSERAKVRTEKCENRLEVRAEKCKFAGETNLKEAWNELSYSN